MPDRRLKAFCIWLQRETLGARPRRSASTFTATLRSNEDLRSAQPGRVNDVQDARRILIHTLAAEPPGSSLRWGRMRLLRCKRAAPEDTLMKFGEMCFLKIRRPLTAPLHSHVICPKAFQVISCSTNCSDSCVPSLDSLKVWQLQSA